MGTLSKRECFASAFLECTWNIDPLCLCVYTRGNVCACVRAQCDMAFMGFARH